MTRRHALKLLQISNPNPSRREIRSAFRKLALSFHPDRHVAGENEIEIFNKLFQQLNSAYESLIEGTYSTGNDQSDSAIEREFREYMNSKRHEKILGMQKDRKKQQFEKRKKILNAFNVTSKFKNIIKKKKTKKLNKKNKRKKKKKE